MTRDNLLRAIVQLSHRADDCKRRRGRCWTHGHQLPCPFAVLRDEMDHLRDRYRVGHHPPRTPEPFPPDGVGAPCSVQPGMLVQRIERLDNGGVTKSPVSRVVEVVRDCHCAPYLFEIDCPLNTLGSGCPGSGDCQRCPKVDQPHIHLVCCDPAIEKPRDTQLSIFSRLVQVDESLLWELDYEHPARIHPSARVEVLGWAPNYQRTLFAEAR